MARQDDFSKVNTPPRGLQDFLGNVNQGVNPHELNHTVNPGVDLIPFWGVDKTTTTIASGSVNGTIGQGIELRVPSGEIWMPVAVSGQYFYAIGNTRAISLRLQTPSGGGLVIVANARVAAAAAAGELTCGAFIPSRFILPTDWGFRCQVDESDNAAASTMEVNITYYKIRA